MDNSDAREQGEGRKGDEEMIETSSTRPLRIIRSCFTGKYFPYQNTSIYQR
jgi:hypothetical protein